MMPPLIYNLLFVAQTNNGFDLITLTIGSGIRHLR